ncbi:MAG TPA: F0F1 ATP synthase subunit B [Kiritimatiellia bacterium]|nr:F0F1 ATP synthase subunit B [Kiritimatiellia bacterium]HMP33583.1 F0F1 ATP synthase subunit B [Kiritimatiellia bacterium]
MADETTYQGTIEVPADHGHAEKPGPIDVSGKMMVLTYVTFAITAIVLYKVAWKPILNALDKREETLRKAMEEAEKTRAEMAAIDQTRARIIEEADKRAREILEQARVAAVETAKSLESKAREESQILLENAKREIHAEQDRAMANLRKESAELAIDISRKLIKDNLDESRSRKLADSLINGI